ncbi:beta-defensin 107A-like [Trichosurus vulpecula]|uniref:beta-defensin 107A-like n=1 Tax=Trichosurus vulpecula TaxID=9337 RepID=UPI00186AFA0F|nr:beta-defensin 107A-like [Trichosurus vulpecula]
MRLLSFIFAILIILTQISPARSGIFRQMYCQRQTGRCLVECLLDEENIGSCRSGLVLFCCQKKRLN